MLGFSFDDHHNSGLFLLDHMETEALNGYHFNVGETPVGGTGTDTEFIVSKDSIFLASSGKVNFALHNDSDCGDELLKLYTTEHDLQTIDTISVDIAHNDALDQQVKIEHTALCTEDVDNIHISKNWL